MSGAWCYPVSFAEPHSLVFLLFVDGKCGQTEVTVFLHVKFSAALEELNAADVLYVLFVPGISSI